jgi:hypothetical protein
VIARHPWTGPIACRWPERGLWGGPPSARGRLPPKLRDPQVTRGKLELASVLRTRLDTVGVDAKVAPAVEDDRWSNAHRLGLGSIFGFALAAAIAAVTERGRARR